MLIEVLYSGWTSICSAVIDIFSNCRDPEYGALLNLFDNYLPLVLSIYSVIFKSNKLLEYFMSVIRVWMMFGDTTIKHLFFGYQMFYTG